jgi:hypothetical protein
MRSSFIASLLVLLAACGAGQGKQVSAGASANPDCPDASTAAECRYPDLYKGGGGGGY